MIFTPKFERAVNFTLDWEGRTIEFDPADPGGVTAFGIDQRDHPVVDVSSLTLEDAKAIYHNLEWTWCNGEALPDAWATVVFDCCVNPGRRSLRWLQAVVGASVDGGIGVQTVASVAAAPVAYRDTLLDRCEAYYRSLADEHKALRRFLKGWLNRNDARRKLP